MDSVFQHINFSTWGSCNWNSIWEDILIMKRMTGWSQVNGLNQSVAARRLPRLRTKRKSLKPRLILPCTRSPLGWIGVLASLPKRYHNELCSHSLTNTRMNWYIYDHGGWYIICRGSRKAVVQSAVEDDGFPDNLAPPKQNMVKRGENTSYLGQAQEFQMSRKKIFSGKIRVNSAKGRAKRCRCKNVQ